LIKLSCSCNVRRVLNLNILFLIWQGFSAQKIVLQPKDEIMGERQMKKFSFTRAAALLRRVA
jgi:hypothetical protein